jgi:uncharacterized membrane protein
LQDEDLISEVSRDASDEGAERERGNLQAQLGMSDKRLATNLSRLKRLRREKLLRRVAIVLTTIGIVAVMLVVPLARGFLWPDPSTFNATCKAVLFLAGFWAMSEQLVEFILRSAARVILWIGQVDEKTI